MTGLLAKAMLITLPFVLLLLDYWPLCRARGESASAQGRRRAWRQLTAEKAPLFVLAVMFSVVQFIVQLKGGAIDSLAQLGLADRLANSAMAYLIYMRRMIWPQGLAVHYPVVPGGYSLTAVCVAIAVLGGVSWLVLRLGAQRRYLVTGWLWYLVALAPVSGIVLLGSQASADRYTYIPVVGLFIMVVWGAGDLLAHRPHGKGVLAVGATVSVAALAALAWVQVGHWRNSETLWQHALSVTSDNHRAHYNLGREYSGQERFEEAQLQFEEALRIRPGYVEAQSNLGYVLAARGLTEQAIAEYRAALRVDPELAPTLINLGNALGELGDWRNAASAYRRALEIDGRSVTGHTNLGNALARSGDFGGPSTSTERPCESTLAMRRPTTASDWPSPS